MKIRSKGFTWESSDPLLEFSDPLIISGTIEARMFKFSTVMEGVSSNEKMQNWVKSGPVGSRGPLLEFWDPSYLGNVWSEKLLIWQKDGGLWVLMKKCKISSKWVMWECLGISGPFPNITLTVEAGIFKFGTEIDGSVFNEKNAKLQLLAHPTG